MGATHTIIHGDSRCMSGVADESVQLVVTSPPYWQLKDYGTADQIGFHESYEDYVNNLNLVWQECARVLLPGGRICINVGDQFARSAWYGRYKVIPIRTEITRFLETIGLDHMGAIIWQKVTTCNTSGGASIMGSFPYPPNGVIKVDYEFILLFKKPGRRSNDIDPAVKESSKLSTEQWNEYFYGHWNFPGSRQDRHLAAFPAELPRRLIRMFSFVGDTVLDPFLGSGTTTLVAVEEGRKSIGYELNPQFIEVTRQRLEESETLFSAPDVTYVSDDTSISSTFESLPYVFRDPVRIERKPGAKLRKFGSRVDGKEEPRRRTFKVIEVVGHDRIRLSDGREITLLGVGGATAGEARAVEHLRELCLEKRVTIEPDALVPDDEAQLLRYVHLPNRKFINGHMVRSSLVDPDVSREYRHRKRFVKYAGHAAD